MSEAYRRWWHGYDPVLGIDIRDDLVVVATRISHESHIGRCRVLSRTIPKGLVEGGLVKAPHLLGSILIELVAGLKGRCKRCAVALPTNASFTAYLNVSEGAQFKDETETYRWAIEQTAIDPSTVRGCVYPVPCGENGVRKVLLVATKSSVLKNLQQVFQGTCLDLDCVTMRAVALHRGASILEDKSYNELLGTPGITARLDLADVVPTIHFFAGPMYVRSEYLRTDKKNLALEAVARVQEEVHQGAFSPLQQNSSVRLTIHGDQELSMEVQQECQSILRAVGQENVVVMGPTQGEEVRALYLDPVSIGLANFERECA